MSYKPTSATDPKGKKPIQEIILEGYSGTPPSTKPQKTKPNPWATPPREIVPVGTVVQPKNPAPIDKALKVTTSAKDGSSVSYRGVLVGRVTDGVVEIIQGSSPEADQAHVLIREGLLTKVSKGELS